jgi:hypothetical protein
MELIFSPIIFLTTLSLLLLYLKIFVVNRKSTTYILIQIVLWLNLLFYIAMTLSVIFSCSPVHKFWDRLVPGKCINAYPHITTSAAFNVASNFATVFLPVRAVWKLQMPLKRKIGVSTVFMGGLLYEFRFFLKFLRMRLILYSACFASIMRLYLSIKDGNKPDVTYNMTAIMLWT